MGVRLIGIDPGTLAVGYGVLDVAGSEVALVGYGAIQASARAERAERLKTLYEGLVELLERTAPERAAVEDVYSGKYARSSIVIGEGRGVVLLALAQAGVPAEAIAPARIKKAVTGRGNARKEQVADMVAKILRMEQTPAPADAADALAIALTLAYRLGRPVP